MVNPRIQIYSSQFIDIIIFYMPNYKSYLKQAIDLSLIFFNGMVFALI